MRKLVFPGAIVGLFGCAFLVAFVTSGLRLGGSQVVESSGEAARGAPEAATAQLAGQVSLRAEYAQVVESANGQSCWARSDVLDGNPEWRSGIPPGHFQSAGGFAYPHVGEVSLVHQETGTAYLVPILAGGQDGELRYALSNALPGEYQLKAHLFYRHPLDPPGAGPRLYSLIQQDGKTGQAIIVDLSPGPALTALDLSLRLTGDVCASVL